MSTLDSSPVRSLLDRLFAEASLNHQQFLQERAELKARGLRLGSEEFGELTRRAYLAVEPETGRLLYLLTRLRRPSTIVEFGTSFGISTLHLASGLRDNGSGTLITTEIEPSKVETARRNLVEAGLSDTTEILEGDALHTIVAQRPLAIDFLFLDGFNHLYVEFFRLAEPDLTPGALVVADNADSPGYREYIHAQPNLMSLSFDGRVEVSLKVA